MHKKQQKMQIKNANKNHFLDIFVCISIAYRTLQRSVRVALNNQDILNVLLREAGSLGGVEVPEGGEGPLHIAGDDGGIGHVGCGIGIHPFGHKGGPLQSGREKLLLAGLTLVEQLDVLLVLGRLDMVGHETLSLDVEVGGAELAEERLGLGMELPHPASSELPDESTGIGSLWHSQNTLSHLLHLKTDFVLMFCYSCQCSVATKKSK